MKKEQQNDPKGKDSSGQGEKQKSKDTKSRDGSDLGNHGDHGDRGDRSTERNLGDFSSNSDRNLKDILEKSSCSRDDGKGFLDGSDKNSKNDKTNDPLNPGLGYDTDPHTEKFKTKSNSVERALAYACEQFDKMVKGLPSNMRDMYPAASGVCKMVDARVGMINTNNKTIGIDKFFHCMGNCRAAEYGLAGAQAALVMDSMKEGKDLATNTVKENIGMAIKDSWGDMKANFEGLRGGLMGERCHDVCHNELPERYR